LKWSSNKENDHQWCFANATTVADSTVPRDICRNASSIAVGVGRDLAPQNTSFCAPSAVTTWE
jgi:hypothetical protein